MAHATNETIVGWVSEPDTRGTASLLFSCVSTIIICISSAVHLDVPFTPPSRIKKTGRQIGNLLLALIAPEWFALLAYVDWTGARFISKKQRADKVRTCHWDLSLSFFVQMGGVLVQDTTGLKIRLPPDKVQVFYDNKWLNPDQLTFEMVGDKSKANWLSKAVASIQIIWFLSQSIGRATSHLSVATIELFTLAYVTCAFWMYGFWWSKPYDVSVPLTLTTNESFTPAEREKIIKKSEYERSEIEGKNGFRPPWQSHHFLAGVTCCALFSVCHLLGWNATFPTPIERLLWRIASVICFLAPLGFFLVTDDFLEEWSKREGKVPSEARKVIRWILVALVISFYCLARLFLLFEVFFALRKVPADVYITPRWSQILPHL
ncbi:hypothetical protein BDV96DRAFT_505427 [Lophiotrema nucula]|uniref:Uncharacterized protein n=1 Tax=Lophiotrema nucula TaxID=690887 RepID=A0A6A5YNE3_9PLEO|nr:hypothetical protein BDV96DRAFT_505427 [Lophiotrema nucula]